MVDRTALAAELQTDPASLGYAPLIQSGADQAIAELLFGDSTYISATDVARALGRG